MAEANTVDWPSPEFRQRIRDNFETYMKQQSISLPVNSVELERSVFEKSSNKKDYVAQLQSYFAATKQKQQQQQLQQQLQQRQQQQQSTSNDNNLAATNNTPQQTIIPNNNNNTNNNNNLNTNNSTNNSTTNNNNISQHQILLQQQLLQQQQQQQQQLIQQQQQQQLDPMNALQHLTKQGLPQGPQGNQLLRPTTAGITPRLHQYPGVINRPNQQVRGEMIAGNPRMITSQFAAGLSPQQFHAQQRSRQMQNMHAFNQMGGSPSSNLLQQQQQQGTTLNTNNTQQQQPLTPQQIQQQLQQPSPAIPTPLGHQSMLTPSPSNHPTQSPATTLTHLSPSSKLQLPSPSHAINTPANEDAEYLQKWEQLQRFIEPLKRTIHNLDKDENRKLDLNKMKNLLDILSDKHKRLSLNTLLKCESVLERQLHMPPSGQPIQSSSEGMIGEELLNLIEANLDNPCLTHSLKRTFKNNNYPYTLDDEGEFTSIKRIKYEDTSKDEGEGGINSGLGAEIKGVGVGGLGSNGFGVGSNGGSLVSRLIEEVERETCHLDDFTVSLNNTQLEGDHLLLICNLDKASLPQVPALLVSVPLQYPHQTPTPLLDPHLYEASDFLKRIKVNLSFDLKSIQHNYSLTTLLNTWESAVVKACSVD